LQSGAGSSDRDHVPEPDDHQNPQYTTAVLKLTANVVNDLPRRPYSFPTSGAHRDQRNAQHHRKGGQEVLSSQVFGHVPDSATASWPPVIQVAKTSANQLAELGVRNHTGYLTPARHPITAHLPLTGYAMATGGIELTSGVRLTCKIRAHWPGANCGKTRCKW
jgi:hypothetical protein